jgi:hypothetical protein
MTRLQRYATRAIKIWPEDQSLKSIKLLEENMLQPGDVAKDVAGVINLKRRSSRNLERNLTNLRKAPYGK